MRLLLLGLLVSIGLLFGAAGAEAADWHRRRARRRHLRGRRRAPCDSTCVVRLVVADDGRSLSSGRSSRHRAISPRRRPPTATNAPRGTRVQRDGSFRWRTRFQVVEGRFAADGRFGRAAPPLPRLARERLLGGDDDVHRAGWRDARRPEGHLRAARQGPARGQRLRAPDRLHEGDARRRRLARGPRLPEPRRSRARACRVAGRRCTPVARRAAEQPGGRGLRRRALARSSSCCGRSAPARGRLRVHDDGDQRRPAARRIR